MRPVLLAIAIVTTPLLMWAQEPSGEDDINYVALTKVSLKQQTKTIDGKKTKVWVLGVKGFTKRLPVGTRAEFHVRWRRRVLERFTFEVGNSKKIDQEFVCLSFDGYQKDLFLRSYIDYNDQTDEVRAEMDKDPAVFWVQTSPWGDTFNDKKFDVGTDKDIEAQDKEIKEYFEKVMLEVVELDKKFGQARKDAQAKRRFAKGDTLDSEKWQAWVEKQIRQPLAKLQKEIARYEHTLKFARHQRDLTAYLTDIVNTVASRTYTRSKKLYKSFGLEAAKEDVYPKLKIGTRKKPTSKFLTKRIKQLCESQEIDVDRIMPGRS